MVEESRTAELHFREWDLHRPGDMEFSYVVPRVKWDFFTRKLLRPLADDHAAEVSENLWVGAPKTGWYSKIRGQFLSAPKWMERNLSYEEILNEQFGPDPGTTFLVHSPRSVYAASWRDMLDVIRRHWLMETTLDTWAICAEKSRAVAFRWEGTGVYFGKRGHRSLTTRCS
jgi:hypothetical protein